MIAASFIEGDQIARVCDYAFFSKTRSTSLVKQGKCTANLFYNDFKPLEINYKSCWPDADYIIRSTHMEFAADR